MKQTVYTIFIDGKIAHEDLSEDEFFDTLEEYAFSYYQTGAPHPDRISHIMKENYG
jgi:hypothetical protein